MIAVRVVICTGNEGKVGIGEFFLFGPWYLACLPLISGYFLSLVALLTFDTRVMLCFVFLLTFATSGSSRCVPLLGCDIGLFCYLDCL